MAGILGKVADVIGGVLNPVKDAIDEFHLSGEEKAEIRQKLLEAEYGLTEKLMQHEVKILELQASIVQTEAQGESWIQRSWRPILMLSIVAIIINNYILAPYLAAWFDWSVIMELPSDLYDVMTFGVTGYIGGRSLEKIAPHVKDLINSKKG